MKLNIEVIEPGKRALATERIRLHLHPPDEACASLCADYKQWSELGCRGEAAFLVNLETGACEGRITHDLGGDIVQVPEDWWTQRCATVSAYVRAQLCG